MSGSIMGVEEMNQLNRERMEGLLDRARKARPLSRTDRNDLRAYLGGRLPWEIEEAQPDPQESPAPMPSTIPAAMRLGLPMIDLPLMQAVRESERLAKLQASREHQLVMRVASACFMERPTSPVGEWAEANVFLDEIATSEPGFYDLARTPWAREWQAMPLRPDVRMVVIKKPSRCGASESALNIIRWMPLHWPGNAGLCYPDDKQARDVVLRRLLRSIQRIATAQSTGDTHDETLSAINLLNMVIRAGGSGSPRLFTEWWVRFWLLDELEEHDTSDTTTTLKRALSRQTDVADALLFAISKPKKRGGPIDAAFVQGTQKKYLLPCPCCGEQIEFLRSGFRYDHCRRDDGTWDLARVLRETWYQCQLCGGRIDEHQKRSMIQLGQWVPTPEHMRRASIDGKLVPQVPGVESYHISDYYALHAEVSWGKLMVMYLTAFVIDPKYEDQVHFINNHEGECEEPEDVTISADAVAALKSGRIESRQITLPDGTTQVLTETLGFEGGYRLSYVEGKARARIPFTPWRIVVFLDKQKAYFKYTVFALRLTPTIDAHLIDLGTMEDEDAVFTSLLHRPYWVRGDTDNVKHYISAGFVDSRYRGQAVFDLCLRAYQQLGISLWPVRGEGEREAWDRHRKNRRKITRNAPGKLIRYIEDTCARGPIVVRYFKDYPVKMSLYQVKIEQRKGWRIWLPNDYPDTLASELTAEHYDVETDSWIHDHHKTGPNDWGDCFKYLVLWMTEHMQDLVEISGAEVEDVDQIADTDATADTDDDTGDEQPVTPDPLPNPRVTREYQLRPRSRD